MKPLKYTTISFGVLWLICFIVLLISKLKSLDETMMALSILNLYLTVICGTILLIVTIIKKIKFRKVKE